MKNSALHLKKIICESLILHFEGPERKIVKFQTTPQKLEDTVWKNIFYLPLRTFKRSAKVHEWTRPEVGRVKKHLEDGMMFYKNLMEEISMLFETKSNIDSDTRACFSRFLLQCLRYLGDLSRYYAVDLTKHHGVEMPDICKPLLYYQQILQFKPKMELTLANIGAVYSDYYNKPLDAALHYVAAARLEHATSSLDNLCEMYHSKSSSGGISRGDTFVKAVLDAVSCVREGTESDEYMKGICIKLLGDLEKFLTIESFDGEVLIKAIHLMAESHMCISGPELKPYFEKMLPSITLTLSAHLTKRLSKAIVKTFSTEAFNSYMKVRDMTQLFHCEHLFKFEITTC